MSFAKAQRFNPDKVCGPPPTAYNPQQPGGSGVISFPKGERFRQDSTPNSGHNQEGTMTRSHSSNSVGSTDSSATTKSHQGKKDHSQCNKQIADLEKELRNITMERNQLLRRRNHPINAGTFGEKTENVGPGPVKDECPTELQVLHTTIQDMQAKLDNYKDLEVEKCRLENERDNTIADLKLKEIEVSRITSQIEELKVAFDKEETLRYELELALKQAVEEKKEMESQLSELGQKIENLENVRVELVKEIESTKEVQLKTLAEQNTQHEAVLEDMRVTHQERVQQLENNLQQLVAEHDAESEQLKFEYGRQIDELNQIHSTAVTNIESRYQEQIKSMQTVHQEEMTQLLTSRDELEGQHVRLRQELEMIGVTLETKVDEVETLKAQLEVANEKLETNRIQAEERFIFMKRSLELDIAECKVRMEEQRRCEEEKLRTSYESQLAQLEEKQVQLTETLLAERAQSEEQMKRLNDNNQTEKEILMWQMSQQKENLEIGLKTEFDRQLSQKEASFEEQRSTWETKLNQASVDYANQLAKIESDHNVQLTNYRELHEAALENLEREKKEIQEERTLVEQKLMEKQVEIEKVTTEMKSVISKLELELEMLRESNNQLVVDLLRVEQDRQVTEERMETEKVLLKSQAEEEKDSLIKSYEEVISSVKAESTEKDEQIVKLTEKLSVTEDTISQQMVENQKQMEEAKAMHETRLSEVTSAHTEEIKVLHKNYERVLADKEVKFNTAHEQLSMEHQEAIESLTSRSATEMQELQDEFRMTFSALERKLATEREDLVQAHLKELDEIKSIYEEKLTAVNKHHEAVVEELNKNNEEAADNIQELQQSLDDLREEFQTLLATGDKKELEHQTEIKKLSDIIQSKEQEIVGLNETLSRREKETADEWIQRETSIMAQFTEQNQKSVAEFEDRLQEICNQLQQAKDETNQLKTERDAALDDVAVFQVQTEAQMAALNEQYDQERVMLLEKLSVQTREIEEINSSKLNELQEQLSLSQRTLEELRLDHSRQLEQMEHEREEAILTAVREALEPVDSELESLRKDREAYLILKKEFQELQARIEPFREQLEMYEAEKKALLNQALFAENSMASLASKYTQLLGHQNSKQKIHHLEKLKQDIFNLRKELADKNLALEKEKKARQKADARVKELSGQKKYDPSEAFKVPENPPALAVIPKAVAKAPKVNVARPSIAPVAADTKEAPKLQRKPLRAHGTGFFLSMDDVEKTCTEMEQEKQARIEARRNASSANFEAFEVDFGNSSAARRETFDVPPKLNVTHSRDEDCNKENVNRGFFPQDISGISVDEMILKNKLKSRTDTNLTSTPLQRHT